MLIPGVGGDSRAGYINATATHFLRLGFNVCVLNPRGLTFGHAVRDVHNIYDALDMSDLHGLLKLLHSQIPSSLPPGPCVCVRMCVRVCVCVCVCSVRGCIGDIVVSHPRTPTRPHARTTVTRIRSFVHSGDVTLTHTHARTQTHHVEASDFEQPIGRNEHVALVHVVVMHIAHAEQMLETQADLVVGVRAFVVGVLIVLMTCLLYTSPSPRDRG